MIDRDLLKKVRKIELSTRHLVNEVFGGEYHSVFKGRGMEFAEVREYMPGDDIRAIDWNVTARSAVPHVKLFEEERELTVMLLVDASASGAFGTSLGMKRQLAAEISAILAFSAIKNNDKVGLLIFSDQVEKYVPPRKGRGHVLRVIREVLYQQPRRAGTDLDQALEFIGRVMKKRAVVFLLSDFIAEGYEKSLYQVARRHDLISMILRDPWEQQLPEAGLLQIHDAETGERTVINTRNARLRAAFRERNARELETLQRGLRQHKIDHLFINTAESYVEPLISFFRSRASRMRR